MVINDYFQRFAPTPAQIARFESAARRNMAAGVKGWGDVWLLAADKLFKGIEHVKEN